MFGLQIKPIFGFFALFAFKSLDSSLFEIQLILFLLWPISTPFMIFISLMENFNFILVLVPKFPGSLNLSFHNLSIHQISLKNPSLAQFIPRIYNKIIIKILGYFGALQALPIQNQPKASFASDTKKNPKDCMAITLRSGKELQSRDEVEKKRTEAETEKAYHNSIGSENKKKKRLSNEAQQLKEQCEVAKEKTV